jgi:FkbM family methyltransferase
MRNAYWDYFKYLVRGLPAPPDEQFSFVKKGMLVFDVGANMGNYASLFLKKGAKVVALEPQSYCYRFLKLRFAFKKNMTVLRKGAGPKTENRELFVSSSHTLSSLNEKWIEGVSQSERFKDSSPDWNKKETISIVTLDSLIQQYGEPDYVKIDVEGFETETLKGLSKPVKLISFEYTIPESSDAAIECVERLSSIGNYLFSPISNEENKWITAEELKKEIRDHSHNGTLYNGDIFAKLIS